MTTPTSSINTTIPVANSPLSSSAIRAQFQAAANDINTIYASLTGYPTVTQNAPNVYVNSAGQLERSANQIPISMTQVWSVLAHDGVSEFYSTPFYISNFVSASYMGPAIVFQGYDWFIYAVNALTGAVLTGFPVATSGPCYGRVVAANIDTGGYAGMSMVIGCTHGNTQGAAGAIVALHSDGTSAWTAYNAFADEGGNDMYASVTQGTTTTLSAAITTTAQTAISVTSGANIANGGYIGIGTEVMLVSAGGGTTSLTVVRAQFGSTAATHSNGATVNTGFPTLGGTTTAGLSVTASTTSSVTIGGTNPNWASNSWTRYEGLGYGAVAMIVTGTGVGQQREITGTTGGNTLTINGTWATNPDTSSKVQILPRYQSDAYFQHAGTLNVESGTTYLYTTGFDNTIVKRNAQTGAKSWRYWTGENNEPFPLIANMQDGITPTVVFNSGDGYTYCLSIAGALLWRTLGASGVTLDSFPLAAANFSNNGGSYLNLAVNQRRSGNSAAGRCYILRGDTGAKTYSSGDLLGDNSSGALPIARNDGTGKYYIFSGGNACLVTLFDDQMNGLWRHRYADNSEIDQFRSSPFLCDVNYDGVQEIVQCMQNTGTVMVWSQKGAELAQLTLPCRIGATDCGIEGSPLTFSNLGINYIIIPSKDGNMFCYKLNQNTA